MDDKFRKQTITRGAASLGLLAVFLTGCGGNDESANPAPAPGTTTQVDPDGATAPMPSAGGTIGATGVPQPGNAVPAGGMGGFGARQQPSSSVKDGKTTARLPYNPRRDPFYVPWTLPKPPPDIFSEVQPLRVATYNVVTPPPLNTEVREVPNRRVSGIMSGDGVFAILESGAGNPEIVKPGMTTSDGYTVVSINADSVKLQKKENNFLYTQIVPLSDLSTNPSTGGMGGRLGGGGAGSMGAMGGGGPTMGGMSRGGGGGVGNTGQ